MRQYMKDIRVYKSKTDRARAAKLMRRLGHYVCVYEDVAGPAINYIAFYQLQQMAHVFKWYAQPLEVRVPHRHDQHVRDWRRHEQVERALRALGVK